MTRPYKLISPPPRFAERKPGQRRMDHGARSRIAEWRAYQAAWQNPINEIACDGERFHHLRRHVLSLNRPQAARLLRVSVSSILGWETGLYPTPFYAYLSLLLISESERMQRMPHRHEWRGWQFIERYNADQRVSKAKRGYVVELVNRELGAVFTARDLEQYALAMSRLAALQSKNRELGEQVEALTLENTEIRELFRIGGVSDELRGMRERVEALLGKINTAHVLPIAKKVAAAA